MAKLIALSLTLLSPVTVWAHAGHTEFFKIMDHAHFQLYEAMLVVAFLMFIALAKPIEGALKKVKSSLAKMHSRHK